MRIAIVLLTLCLTAFTAVPAGATQIIDCNGVNDSAAIQTAIDQAHAEVVLRGAPALSFGSKRICRLVEPLMWTEWGVTLRGERDTELFYDGPGYAITIWGVQRAEVATLGLQSSSGGVLIGGMTIHARFRAVRVSAYGGDAFHLEEGAGFWLNGQSNINGTPGTGSRGIAIVGPWDTFVISDVIVEEHDTCVRLGGSRGFVAAGQMINVTCDRLRSVALHIEPSGTGAVFSIQATNINTLRGLSPVLINSAGTTGYVGAIILTNWSVQGARYEHVWTWGPMDRLSVAQFVYRP